MAPFLDVFGLLSGLLGPHADPAASQHWVLSLTHSDHSARKAFDITYVGPYFSDEEIVTQRVPQIPALVGKVYVP